MSAVYVRGTRAGKDGTSPIQIDAGSTHGTICMSLTCASDAAQFLRRSDLQFDYI